MLAVSALLLSAWLTASPVPPEPTPEAPAIATTTAIEHSATVHALRFNPPVDGAVTFIGISAWTFSETAIKRSIAPRECRWCDRGPNGEDTLNALDRAGRSVRWSADSLKTPDTLSNISGFGLVPLSMAGIDAYLAIHHGAVRAIPEDLVIIAESVALSMVVNQAVKMIVGRERPFVHALPAEERPFTNHPDDNNLSFYSGHSAFVFSIVVATGVVAEERGYRGRALIWAVGLPLAASTAYFRMAADRHYLTDVLVGMAAGSAFGIGIPLLLHPRVGSLTDARSTADVRLVPTADGAALVGRF